MYDSVHLFGDSPGLTQAEQDWNEIVREQRKQSAAYRADIYGVEDHLTTGSSTQPQEGGSSGQDQAPGTSQAQEIPRFKPGPYTSQDNVRAQRFGWTKTPPTNVDCTNVHTPENSWDEERTCMDSDGRPWERKRIPMNNLDIYDASKGLRKLEQVRNAVGIHPAGAAINIIVDDYYQEYKAKELDKINDANYYYRAYQNR